MAADTRRIPLPTWLSIILVVACSGGVPARTVGPSAASDPSVSPSATRQATAGPTSTPRGPDAWLVVGRPGAEGTQVIIASTGEVEYELPEGVPDTTWGRLLSVSTDGSTTTVKNLAIQPGFGGDSLSVPGAWRLPTIGSDPGPVGVSEDRRTIVLVGDRTGAAAPTAKATRFAIVRAPFDAAPRIVELRGEFEYDALAPDGSILYVIEHLPGPPARHYQVRMIDVASGMLRPEVVADKTGGEEAMAGYPLAQLRQSGGMVFTLYRGSEHPFIHALQSAERWAICIDLPVVGAADDAAALDWGMGAAPDGGSIFAVDATLGLVARVSTGDLSVADATFKPIAATGVALAKFGHSAVGNVGRRVVVAPRGGVLYAAGATGVVRLSTGDLAVSGRLLDGTRIEALAITPDGGMLYALTIDGRIVGVDTATGQVRGEVPGAGFDRLLGVAPFS